MIGGHAVFLPHGEISEIAPGHELLRAIVRVFECDVLSVRHTETPVTVGFGWRGLFTASTGVNRFTAFTVRRGNGVFQIATAARARKQVAQLLELFESFPIQAQSIGLMKDIAFPVKADPAAVFHGGLGVFRFATVRIQILIAIQQRATGGSGTLLGDPERTGVAQVQIAGGRGG